MYIKSLYTKNFRNLNEQKVIYSPELNIILGKNGVGKTNLIEAIYYLFLAKSFRTNLSHNIINNQYTQCFLSSLLEDENGIEHLLGMSRDSKSEISVHYDGKKLNTLNELALIQSILIVDPQVLDILSTGPTSRRKFLDWGCYYHYPKFRVIYSKFIKVLRQRNKILRDKSKNSLDYEYVYWNNYFIELSEQINSYRKEYIKILNTEILSLLEIFFPKQNIQFEFKLGYNSDYNLSDYIARISDKEFALGCSQAGAHRADFSIKIDNKNIIEFMSRGQIKLLVCALKISQALLCYKYTNRKIIFLMDDIASELDLINLNKILNFVSRETSKIQFFITMIDENILDKINIKDFCDVKVFKINKGEIEVVSRET